MNKLQQLRKELIDVHERKLAYLDKQAALLGPLLDEMEKLEPTSVYVEDGYLSIGVSGDKHKLNAAFGALRRHGLKTSDRPEKGQSQYMGTFTKPETVGLVFLNFSSTQCRRVKVGQRTREVTEDVYEVVCDEMVLDAEHALPPAPKPAEELPF